MTVVSSCIKCKNTVIVELNPGESHGAKYVCTECADSNTASVYYPEITGFNRKELTAGDTKYVHIPYKTQEELALEELRKCCIY